MRQVAMLRGINLGPQRRISMPDLRARLSDAGYGDVATYVQSGNVVLESEVTPAKLERELAALIEQSFGLAVPVCVRSAAELQAVLDRDPIPGGAEDPKRYYVTFLAVRPTDELVARLSELARDSETLVGGERELYSYHPDGVAGSRLSTGIVGPASGANATSRNFSTVTKLAQMARS